MTSMMMMNEEDDDANDDDSEIINHLRDNTVVNGLAEVKTEPY